MQLLTQLVSAPTKADRDRLLNEASELVSPELVQVVDMLQDQAKNAGQADLSQRLGQIRAELNTRLLAST